VARRSFVGVRRGFVRPAGRANLWLGIDIDGTAVAADSSVLLASLNAAALALRPFTVVRVRALIRWQSDQIASTEGPTGAFGAVVTSDQAASATTVPSPINNPDGNFFVWEPLITQVIFGTGVGFIEPAGYYPTVDSKAMRKVGNNEDVRFMVENSHPTDGALIAVVGRMLVKLH